MSGSSAARDVRPSPIAGTWYPGDEQELEAAVDGLLAQAARPALPGRVCGLIAPHAGYHYSGRVAANAYAQLSGHRTGTVVLLGPDHRGATGAFGIAAYRRYATPLGQVEIDADLAAAVGRGVALQRIEDDEEHSLEIQLPFLQRTLGSFKLLPIMLGYPLARQYGQMALSSCRSLADALVTALQGRDDVLLVASTDLAHLYDYREVARLDAVFTALVAELDPATLASALMEGRCHACGGAAVVTAMTVLKERGATSATVLAYSNSAEITGRQRLGEYTVGYAAAALTM